MRVADLALPVCVACGRCADGVIGSIGGARAQLAQAHDLLSTAIGGITKKN
jgi:hypothetical protein